MSELTLTVKKEVTPEMLRDILVTFVESGGYAFFDWVDEYRYSGDYFHARVVLEEEEDTRFLVDWSVIFRGLERIVAGPIVSLHDRTRLRIVSEILSDEPDLDAADADIIVQLGLFGSVVYG